MMKNIVLIGMPGSGKSTLGVLLAKSLGYSFVDTDLIISRKAEKPLQQILDCDGIDRFLELERQVGIELECDKTVVATGGSMVLSDEAMHRLKPNATVVYINVAFDEIKRRVKNIKTRGIVFRKNETLETVYQNRKPLYEKYADIEISVSGKAQSIEETVDELAEKLKNLA